MKQSDIAVSVSNVSKCYRVFDNQRSRLLHAVWPAHTKGMQEVWALKGINFEIKRGEAVAIIGRNGGGKSTLLEILTGTLTPTTGSVKVHGRVSALLELGSGFNPEYSGRDNVILNGLLLGLSKDDILSRFNEIEAFAEIGAAIDRPVKTYSSGMMMRLAFAVQVLCDPDILIIDEALSVGDFFFQQKCLSYIRTLCAKGVTLVFVSHDMGTIRDMCDRVIYLKLGKICGDGNTMLVISRYFGDSQGVNAGLTAVARPASAPATQDSANCYDQLLAHALWRNSAQAVDREGKLLAVAIRDESGLPSTSFKIGDRAVVLIAYVSDLVRDCHAGLSIRNKFGDVVSTAGSYFSGSALPLRSSPRSHANVVICEIRLELMLESGQYSLEASCGQITLPNRSTLLDSTPPFGPIDIFWDYERDAAPFLGRFGLRVECSCYLSK